MNKYTDRAIKKVQVTIVILVMTVIFCTAVTLMVSDLFVLRIIRLMAIVSASGLILTPGVLFWLWKEGKMNEERKSRRISA